MTLSTPSQTPSKARLTTVFAVILPLFGLLVGGCQQNEIVFKERYVVLESQGQNRLPLSPHVLKVQAQPTEKMKMEQLGTLLQFRILDKRTLQVHSLEVAVGEVKAGPWEGMVKPLAFVPDLVLRDGLALHGEEGHVNPATWIVLEDAGGEVLHQGWVFSRDSAQTAWDNHRYDLTFLGTGDEPPGEGS
ncbi:MAG: hypothetical protein HQL53_01390 [Magnetococcales bacterium]|nr:hypothetical protein [Magnetococcales bacterium]